MSDRGRDILTIVLAVACLAVLGGGGAALSRWYALPPGHYIVDLELIIWVAWACHLTGKIPGFLLGGALLGRFLRRINPWKVFHWVAAWMVGVVVLGLVAGSHDAVSQVAVMGVPLALMQQSLSLATGLGAVAAGIWFGEKIKARKALVCGDRNAAGG